MKLKRILFFYSLLIFTCISFGQQKYPKQPADILKYIIDIQVTDENNKIKVTENVHAQFSTTIDTFYLDLTNFNGNTGMQVSRVLEQGYPVSFIHKNNRIGILVVPPPKNTPYFDFQIEYEGIPSDGLIIGKNKFNERTFFGDNWPQRAHHWFACIDHPSDKAFVRFKVAAPSHYQVIANGKHLESTSDINNPNITRHIFETNKPIPSKVIVIGLANFEIERTKYNKSLETSTWVYPKDKTNGKKDFALKDSILKYYEKNIGTFPFEKLAHVQSTTMYGGMENASCIFYDENVIKGDGKINELIAHEIVHQWFGNSASEKEWSDLWLSEGFATYLTNLYIEDVFGKKAFREQLLKDRKKVISFAQKTLPPLKDTLTQNVQDLLNPNAYQKGSWILHMIREQIGIELFWKVIQNYYKAYQYSNASSKDFFKILEKTTDKDFNQFYKDWVTQPGHPIISTKTKEEIITDSTSNLSQFQYTIDIKQQQKIVFRFPLEVEILFEDNTKEFLALYMDNSIITQNLLYSKRIKQLILDPNCKLLFDEGKPAK
ncbi:MAG: M1 family aminopeptidase [Crocinitomicaceae bacterium]|jgi:aminopeptidase N